jgi:hypothetical protein
MKRLILLLALASLACLPASAQAAFGIDSFDVTYTNEDGTTATQAGSHPFAMTTSFNLNYDEGTLMPEGWVRDLIAEQVPGFVADTTAYPRCSNVQFLEVTGGLSACPLETQVGVTAVSASAPTSWSTVPLFNLTPPPGVLARFGFTITEARIVVDAGVDPETHNAVGATRNTSQLLEVFGSKLQLWGDPSDPAHDEFRGLCAMVEREVPPGEEFEFEGKGKTCPTPSNSKPFLTLPTTCSEALTSSYEAISWEGDTDSGSVLTHDSEGNPQPFTGCGKLGFKPSIGAQPTTKAAQSPSGLDLSVKVKDEGLTSLEGLSQSRIRKVALTLPEGMTANPSVAEGLEVCSESDLKGETLSTAPGEGCPQASKLGTVEVESPLVAKTLKGSLYQATPYENLAEDSLIAFYFVIRDKELGVLVKQTAKVEPDPKTGQLTGITDEVPQLPFSEFRLKFREGARSPLISPPSCGTHTVKAMLTPWSGGSPIEATSSFQIVSGPNEGPCPKGGTPPFEPGFSAGTLNNNAASHSPFLMRLTRRDGDQDLVRFDVTLPPGVVAKLAGVGKCTEAQIAQLKGKTGKEELASPSCPASSKIGTVKAGAGVGSQLTYVQGSVYLAGPFGKAPLSVIGVVPAVAGPFDVGVVFTREALTLDPVTGEVKVDGSLSDPLPHILAGIPLSVRDIQVDVDRPQFTLNPTSCEQMAVGASIWGGGIDPFALSDDSPVGRSSRFQAANCASLGFKPKLAFQLKGGTKRGANPAFKAILRPRSGDANLKSTSVLFPRATFLDQAHIRTVCTRVQFAADNCPTGSIYGQVTAHTPLLEEPLRGPVYLRSSDNLLPDIVFDLKGVVDIEASARADSVKGRLRVTFPSIPDAPVSKVVVQMQGARKGLLVNSTDVCAAKPKAQVRLGAHNGRGASLRPVMRARGCGGKR